MREFDYTNVWKPLLRPDIVSLLTQIHEYKGEQTMFIEAKPDILTSMLEIARIQSTAASNEIEGIFASDERLREIVLQKAQPRSRNEEEIAGYRDVLATIHESHDYIPLRPSTLLQLHRDLYKFSGRSMGGRFKDSDNVIEEWDSSGGKRVRFRPLSAFETPDAIERLCDAFSREADQNAADPLLLLPIFVLDFLCIHPFIDGNGRMSRLITLLLLYRFGYVVGKYISIEMLVGKTKETYYDSLAKSSIGWHEERNDYVPFVSYMLGVVLNAYREFSSRVEYLTLKGLSKPDRVRAIIRNKVGKITKKEILELCPDISIVTVQRTLADLVKRGEIIKISGGRYAAYAWNGAMER